MTKLLAFSLLLIFFNVALGEDSTQQSIYSDKLDVARDMIKLEKLLLEVEKNFTFNSYPIHPRIIKSFENWEEDLEEPYRISCDLNMASNTVKYLDLDIIKRNDGWVGFISEKTDSVIYEYKFIGSLKNKLNIVISKSLMGYTLHAFECKIEQGLSHKDLKLYNRLSLKNYFQMRLQSIDDIFIKDNDVVVDGRILKIERETSADVEGKVYKLGSA
jgi:hypothetical protein